MSDFLAMAERLGGIDQEHIDPQVYNHASKPLGNGHETQAAAALSELMQEHQFTDEDECMEFMGSISNESHVRQSIFIKYGAEAAEEYEPCVQVKPKTEWLRNGYVIREGEQRLCGIITYHHGQQQEVDMWHINQVERK